MSRPRIRTLKPELWEDERIGGLSRDARLLLIGLITMADDEGRLRAAPAMILGHVFPYDPDAAEHLHDWLGEITGCGLVIAYDHDGHPYCAFRHWLRHQRPNRARPSVLPPPPDAVVVAENALSEASLINHCVVTDQSLTDQCAISDVSVPRARARAQARGSDPLVVPSSTNPPQTPVAREREGRAPSRRVDPEKAPAGLPEPLLAVAHTAQARLLDVHEQRGGDTPTLRGVGLAVKRYPDRDHLGVLGQLEHWALAGRGQGQAVKDWARTYGTFLERSPAGAPSRPGNGRGGRTGDPWAPAAAGKYDHYEECPT